MDAILDDRPADREAELSLTVLLVADIVDVACESFAAVRVEQRPVHLVCPAARHGVHEHATEVALPDVEGREQDLKVMSRLVAAQGRLARAA